MNYKKVLLLIIGLLFISQIVNASLFSQDKILLINRINISQNLDSLCNKDNSFLYRFSGLWSCGQLNTSQMNVTITFNVTNTTYYQLNESDPVWNKEKNNYILFNGNNSNVSLLSFNTSASNVFGFGQMGWDTQENSLSIGYPYGATLQVGKELYHEVTNLENFTLLEGQAVSVVGVTGNREGVRLTNISNLNSTLSFIGLTTTVIAPNQKGLVTILGDVHNLNTNYCDEGKELYVNITPGTLTTIKPVHPYYITIVGICVVKQINNGIISVNPHILPKVQDLSDVDGYPLTTTGQFLVWNQTPSVFDANYNINNYYTKNESNNLYYYNASGWIYNGTSIVTNDSPNVGIGTTTPTQKLHVGGNVNITGNVTASNFYGNISYQSCATGFCNTSTQITTSKIINSTTTIQSNSYINGDGKISISTTGIVFNNMQTTTPATYPSSSKGFSWTITSDGAGMNVYERGSDRLDYVFTMRDNVASLDRYLWQETSWTGLHGTTDAMEIYPGLSNTQKQRNIIYGGLNIPAPSLNSNQRPDTNSSKEYGVSTIVRNNNVYWNNGSILNGVQSNVSMSVNVTNYTLNYVTEYIVKIQNTTSNPNTFCWGQTKASVQDVLIPDLWNACNVNLSTSPITLINGITITFNATNGSVFNETFGFSVLGSGGLSVDSLSNSYLLGKVGIGTANPEFKTDVSSTGNTTLQIRNNEIIDGSFAELKLIPSTAPNSYVGGTIRQYRSSTNPRMAISSSSSSVFQETISILSLTGFVGINTTNPVKSLDVNGNLNVGNPINEGAGIYVNYSLISSSVQVNDLSNNDKAMIVLHRHSTTDAPMFLGARSFNDTSSHTTMASGVSVLDIVGVGVTGNSYQTYNKFGQISFVTSNLDSFTATNSPGDIVFYTTPNGSITPTEKMRITSEGNINISNNLYINNSGMILGNLTFKSLYQPLILDGNATVWNDVTSPFFAKPGQLNAPVFDENIGTYYFEDKSPANLEEYGFVEIQLPHSYKENTSIGCHIHIMPSSNNTGNATFLLNYSWTNYKEVDNLWFSFNKSQKMNGSAYYNDIINFGLINGTNKTISSILRAKIRRLSADSSDTFTGNVYLDSFDCHYESDTLGSASEYGKWS